MKSARWLLSYMIMAALGLWLAFALSMNLMTPARSQEAPASGDLPPEFLNEVNSGTPPAQPSPGNQAPPGAMPSQVPPPPAMPPEAPMPDVPPSAPVASPGGVNETAKDGYMYDPTGKRDPFRPFRAARPIVDPKSKDILEPLQRWDLDKLQIVGILWDVRVPRAMVRDPDGRVHTIIKSSRIGRAEGIVAAIREGEVVVIETSYEDGKVLKESRVLELKR